MIIKISKICFTLTGLKQIIRQPTRVTENSSTLIDIILTTHENRVYNSIVYPNSFSDHELIEVIRKLHIQKYQPRKILVRDYSKYNNEVLKSELRNISWLPILSENDAN